MAHGQYPEEQKKKKKICQLFGIYNLVLFMNIIWLKMVLNTAIRGWECS